MTQRRANQLTHSLFYLLLGLGLGLDSFYIRRINFFFYLYRFCCSVKPVCSLGHHLYLKEKYESCPRARYTLPLHPILAFNSTMINILPRVYLCFTRPNSMMESLQDIRAQMLHEFQNTPEQVCCAAPCFHSSVRAVFAPFTKQLHIFFHTSSLTSAAAPAAPAAPLLFKMCAF